MSFNTLPRFLAAMLFAIVLAPEASAQAFKTDDQVGDWMTFYYRKPDSARAPEALRYMSGAGLLKNDKTAPPVIGFLAGMLGSRPKEAPALVRKMLFLREGEQHVLVLGIWYSGLADTKAILKEIQPSLSTQKAHIDELLANTPPRLSAVPLDHGPWIIDALWGNFMATGGDEPVKRIMAALPWAKDKSNIPRNLIGTSARWSLVSNAVQHDRVLEIARAQVAAQPPEVADPLKEVVRAAEDERLRKR